MTVKDAINAVRVMLGSDVETKEVEVIKTETPVVETEMEQEEGKEEEKKSQMAEATLVDGVVVYTEGELAVGSVLYVQTEEEEEVFAPLGKHATQEGLLITVGEAGLIESIEEIEEEAEPVAEEANEEKKEEEMNFSKEDLLNGIAELVKPFQTEINTLKEELSVLSERFEAVADAPAAQPVKQSFMEDAKTKKAVAAARFDRLSQIRRGNK